MQGGGLGEGSRRKRGGGGGGAGRGRSSPRPCARHAAARLRPRPVPSGRTAPSRKAQGSAAEDSREPAGSVPRRDLLVKQKHIFSGRTVCAVTSWQRLGWGPGGRRPARPSACGPRSLSGPGHQSGLFISELKQHAHSTGTGWAMSSELGGGGRPLRAISKHFPEESLQLVRLDEMCYPKHIIIMNLHFFPQENN